MWDHCPLALDQGLGPILLMLISMVLHCHTVDAHRDHGALASSCASSMPGAGLITHHGVALASEGFGCTLSVRLLGGGVGDLSGMILVLGAFTHSERGPGSDCTGASQ